MVIGDQSGLLPLGQRTIGQDALVSYVYRRRPGANSVTGRSPRPQQYLLAVADLTPV